tara:strand:- start:29830 stop:30363 length:534 start_codon:yes stop_codon:yes gene_type:complete
MNRILKSLSSAAVLAVPALVFAAGDHGGMHGDMKDGAPAMAGRDMAGMHGDAHASMAGTAGDPAKASRTIALEMNDTMRFAPDQVTVNAGETVRFYIVNKGKMPHEMVIGTAEEIDEHAAMMRKMPGMVHKEANQITLAPGQRGGIVWQFAKAGTVTYACLVPGHKEAGMMGTIRVE